MFLQDLLWSNDSGKKLLGLNNLETAIKTSNMLHFLSSQSSRRSSAIDQSIFFLHVKETSVFKKKIPIFHRNLYPNLTVQYQIS